MVCVSYLGGIKPLSLNLSLSPCLKAVPLLNNGSWRMSTPEIDEKKMGKKRRAGGGGVRRLG